jgi:hypothetical protein
LGHCLGMDHSSQPSIMKNPFFYGFSPDDAAGIGALYGSVQAQSASFRLVMPGLSRD